MPYKCKCGLFLVNHYCSGCNVLNECGIQTYCPGCEDHPMDPIPIKTDTMSDVLWLLWYVLLIVGVREKRCWVWKSFNESYFMLEVGMVIGDNKHTI